MCDASAPGPTLFGRLYAGLYYGVQRARGGVRPEEIRRAARLLDADQNGLRAHVEERLAALHDTGPRPMEWLGRQPLVERTELRSRMAELEPTLSGRSYEHRKTSGSTGTPFALVKDRKMTAQMDAAMWAAYRWHGVEPGLPHARFWGMPMAPAARAKTRMSDRLLHRRRLDAFDLAEQRAARFFHALRRFKPAYAYGYPSLIAHFVAECRRAGLDGTELGLHVVIITGELLRDEGRAVMEDFFGCRVVNEYGCTESGVLGMECEEGRMHVIPTAAYPEVVAENGAPSRPGEVGEMVVTDLYGRFSPLVRYRLRDRGVHLDERCACGRALPLIRIDMGRIDSFIRTPQKGPVYDAVLAYTMPQSVQRFRAYQTAVDHLRVEVVPGTTFDPELVPGELRKRWEELLGPGMSVTVQLVDDLPHEPSGKLRYFVPLGAS